jgi:hypothetical protein
MNILLVYPEFPDTFWSFKHALKFIHKKTIPTGDHVAYHGLSFQPGGRVARWLSHY